VHMSEVSGWARHTGVRCLPTADTFATAGAQHTQHSDLPSVRVTHFSPAGRQMRFAQYLKSRAVGVGAAGLHLPKQHSRQRRKCGSGSLPWLLPGYTRLWKGLWDRGRRFFKAEGGEVAGLGPGMSMSVARWYSDLSNAFKVDN